MSLIFNIMAFMGLSAILAIRYEKKLVETQVITLSGIVLCLFGLAFFNKMWIIDYICAGVVFICVGYFSRRGKEFIYAGMKLFLEPSWIISAFVILIGSAALAGRGVQGWDEINFWAGDIKSIYTLEGYASEGFNFSKSYGDYPPAYQLIAAWVLHLFNRYDEGLMMSAYFLAMQIYLAPLFRKVPRNILIYIGVAGWLFFIFSFGPNILYDRGPDVLMGVVYGASLMAIFDIDRKNINYYYFKVALLLSVLVIVKSIGIQWVVFAEVFLLCIYATEKNGSKIKVGLSCGAPLGVYIIWMLFCKVRSRSTYLVGDLVSSVSGDKNELIAQHGKRLAGTFVRALFKPMQSAAWGLGVSVAVCFTAYIIIIICYRHFKLLSLKQTNILLGFVIVGGILEYSILLFSTITMFIGEYANYEVLDNMVLLVKRYGAPYIIGTTMLLLSIFFEKLTEKRAALAWGTIIIINLLISPIQTQWKYIFSYRNIPGYVESNIREKFPDLKKACDLIDATGENYNQRLAIIMEIPENMSALVAEVWLKYYAAPMPVHVEIVENIDDVNIISCIQNDTSFGIVDEEERCLTNGIETNKIYPIVQ